MSEDVKILTSEAGYNRQDPKPLPVVAFGLAILTTLFLVFAFVIAYYGTVLEDNLSKYQQTPVSEGLQKLRGTEDQTLHQYKYIDQSKGVVGLTVERSMELLLKEAQEKKTFYAAKAAPIKVDAATAAAGAPVAQAPAVQAPAGENAKK